MDKYIEILAVYWIDWQQTAIANTRYSVVLAVLAIFIGGLVVAALKRKKIVRLMFQVMQEKQHLEKAEKKQQELLNKQNADAELITELNQKLEQSAVLLQQEREQHQANIANKDEVFIKAANEKKLEIETIKSALNEKTRFSEQLQSKLNEQKEKIAQYSEAQAKIVSLENQLQQSVTELDSVKQQLQAAISGKAEQDDQAGKLKQTIQTQIDRILKLESQIDDVKNTSEGEQKQKLEEQLETERKQQEQDRIAAERESKSAEELERKVQLQNQQLAEANEKAQAERKVVEETKQDVQFVSEQVDDKIASVASEQKKTSLVDGVLGWFSSLDKEIEAEVITEPVTESRGVEKTESVEQKRESVSEIIQKPLAERPVEPVEKKPATIVKKEDRAAVIPDDQDDDSFSGKLAEVADKMDSFQEKLKGYFKRG